MKLDLAIKHLKLDLKYARRSLRDLKEYEREHPKEVAIDRAMWKALIPQLVEAVRILKEKNQ